MQTEDNFLVSDRLNLRSWKDKHDKMTGWSLHDSRTARVIARSQSIQAGGDVEGTYAIMKRFLTQQILDAGTDIGDFLCHEIDAQFSR